MRWRTPAPPRHDKNEDGLPFNVYCLPFFNSSNKRLACPFAAVASSWKPSSFPQPARLPNAIVITELAAAAASCSESANALSRLRAARFEALQDLSPRSLAIAYLEQAGVASVKIAAEYRTTSPVDTMTPPLTVRVEGDAVFLTFVRRVAGSGWQTIVPMDPTTLGVDLIGAVSYLSEKATRSYEADADLKRLRLSPAFTRPFTLRP